MIDNFTAPMAEKAILSMILKKPETWLTRARGEGLAAEHFFVFRAMWREITARQAEGKSLELTTLIQDAHLGGTLDDLGGPAGVTEIYTFATDGMSYAWGEWVGALREALARRNATKAVKALSEVEDGAEAVRVVTDALEAISGSLRGPKRSAGGKELAREFHEWFQSSHESGDIPGLSTGIELLDDESGGMRPGELIVVCGKPSRGKSVLMLQIAGNVVRAEKKVAVFSLEMMKREVTARMVSYLGRVNFEHIMQPRKAVRGDLIAMERILKELATSTLWVSDEGGQTIDQIAGEAERIRDANGGIDLLVVDYIQLCDGDRARGESREQEVARVSSGLKKLAKKLGCPVVTGSQLNSDGQTRESRSIEQDADCMLFIVEDGVKIGKLRNGKRDGLLPLFLNGALQRFERGHSTN